MTIYERIKERRKQLGLSADAVAAQLGISRATVYRYESAEIEKLPITALEPLADILCCSPAYLMGWSDDLNFKENSKSLDNSSRLLLSNYEQLNDEGKEKLISYSNDLVDTGRYLKENQSGLDKKKMA